MQQEYLGDLIIFVLIYLVSGLLWKILIQLTGMEPSPDNSSPGGAGLFCSLTAGWSLDLYFLPVLLELTSLPLVLYSFPVS